MFSRGKPASQGKKELEAGFEFNKEPKYRPCVDSLDTEMAENKRCSCILKVRFCCGALEENKEVPCLCELILMLHNEISSFRSFLISWRDNKKVSCLCE